MHWFAGLFIGLIAFLMLGGVLNWLLCQGQQAPFEPRVVAAPVAPAPERAGLDAEAAARMPIMAGAMPQAVAAAQASVASVSEGESAPGPRKAEKKTKAEKAAKKAAKAEKPGKDKSGKKKAKALLDAPRGGQADDLKEIKGVGPKIEVWLNDNGIWHFDQIAAWDGKDVAAYMDRMGRMGTRIESDEWVAQAKAMAAMRAGGKVY